MGCGIGSPACSKANNLISSPNILAMHQSKEYSELMAETRAKFTIEELREAFTNRTHEALFRRIATTARREMENASATDQVWLGFELATDSPMLRQYPWYGAEA
jgi:hypothetical protein